MHVSRDVFPLALLVAAGRVRVAEASGCPWWGEGSEVERRYYDGVARPCTTQLATLRTVIYRLRADEETG